MELPWSEGNYVATVELLIDGVELPARPRKVMALGVVPMLAGDLDAELTVWGTASEKVPVAHFVPVGLPPVATCGCTIFGCGGRVLVSNSDATRFWHDFHEVLNPDQVVPVDLGKLVFNRRQYKDARYAFVTSAAN
jgi:hypothetical protein